MHLSPRWLRLLSVLRRCFCFFVNFLFIVTPIVGVCDCSMFCCTLLCVHSSIAIILIGKKEMVALLNLSSWCLVMVERLFLAVPRGCLRFVIVVFPDHTHLLFLMLHKVFENYMSLHKHVTLAEIQIIKMFTTCIVNDLIWNQTFS